MADIVKAIEKEKEYLEHRMKDEEPFHLVDKIRECGFESLDEYFKEKKSHQFNNVEFHFVETPMPDAISGLLRGVETNTAEVGFVDWEDTYAVCGNRGLAEFNRTYCEENGISFFPLGTIGGTIIGGKGDFSFSVCASKSVVDRGGIILDGVRAILQKYTTKSVIVVDNDICVDGKKVCGSAIYENDKMLKVIMHLSFQDRASLISIICTTLKVCKPVGYVDFMTRAEFKKEVCEWLRVHSS